MRISRLSLTLAATAVVASTGLAAPAFAAPPLVPDVANEPMSYVSSPTVTATVPSGVCSGIFAVRGGAGGGPSLLTMAPGGEVSGNLPLQAGQIVRLSAGTSADGSGAGGLGGYAVGGDVSGGTPGNYGGGAASSLIVANTLIAVAGGGGGYGSLGDIGGAGGGGTGGAGADGANGGGAGGPLTAQTSAGDAGVGIAGGGGGGYSGGSAPISSGHSGGGGSNYFNSGYSGIGLTFNGAQGGAANGFSGVTYLPCQAPSAPATLTVTPNGTSASLSFPRSVDNGSPVTGYQYSIDGGQNWNSLTTSGTTTKTATITALTVGTSYTVDVRPTYLTAAINANQGGNVIDYGAQVSANFAAAVGASSVTGSSSSSLSATGFDARGLLAAGVALALAGFSTLFISRRRRTNR